VKPSKINKLNNFIAGWYIDKKVCDDLINYFEKSPKKTPGVMKQNNEVKVFKDNKISTDLRIDHDNNDIEIENYYKQLNKVLEEYKKKYIYCDINQDGWTIIRSWNIQKYNPKEGFFKEHCERSGLSTASRHLVFMTYLNDVTDKGETYFLYQKLKVKPEKGLTLIWGVDWTFTHKGITSPTQTKYITTGWYSYRKN